MNKEKPNILLITSDQQHYDTLGIDNPRIKTPNLDRLAQDGTLFTRAYCNSPVCSPSRSTMITGMYPSYHGCWNLGCKLPEDVPTIGDALIDNGFVTSLIGKAHFQPLATQSNVKSLECQPILRDLDFWRGFHGPWYGFQNIEIARNHGDEAHVGQHYAIWMEEHGLANWRDFYQQWPPAEGETQRQHEWDLPEELHYTTWTADKTIEAIRRDTSANKPFFTWASFHDPHPPYLVPEPWASMYDPDDMVGGTLDSGELELLPPHFALTQQVSPDFSSYQESPYGNHGFHTHLMSPEKLRKNIAVYYGMISFMDRQIGRILQSLEETGGADNTIVVFTTDHGHFLGQHGLVAKGAFHFEDLLRLPFLVRKPGDVPAGRRSNALQSLVDLAPTFLSACGIDVPAVMQGVNQWDVWRGVTDSARDEVIVEFRHQPSAVQLRTYIDHRYKLTVYRNHEYGELFDLEKDPEERHNLWDNPASLALKLKMFQRLANAELTREPMPLPRIADA
jgi:arylsulfatase A-like enzyme